MLWYCIKYWNSFFSLSSELVSRRVVQQKVGQCRCRDGSLGHQRWQRTRSSPDLSADRCWRCRTRRHGARSHQSLPAGQPTVSAAVICRPWLLQCCHQATVPSMARSVDPPRYVALHASFRRLLYNRVTSIVRTYVEAVLMHFHMGQWRPRCAAWSQVGIAESHRCPWIVKHRH